MRVELDLKGGHMTVCWKGVLLLVLAVLVLPSCGRSGFFGPNPEVKEANVTPRYFCSGESLVFTWRTKDIDKIELWTNSGVLYQTTASSGTFTTPPIRREMLPLKVIGYVRDRSEAREVDVVNIDNPDWTRNYDSTEEITSTLRKDTNPYRTETFTGAGGASTTVNYYKLYQTYSGFKWDIPIADFSARAKVEQIENRTDRQLTFDMQGAMETLVIDPYRTGELRDKTHHPGRAIFGRHAPEEREIGIQRGEYNKLNPDPNYTQEITYTARTVPVRLHVICG